MHKKSEPSVDGSDFFIFSLTGLFFSFIVSLFDIFGGAHGIPDPRSFDAIPHDGISAAAIHQRKPGPDLLSQRGERANGPQQAGAGRLCLCHSQPSRKAAKKGLFHHPIWPGGFFRMGCPAYAGGKGEKYGTGPSVFPWAGPARREKGRHPELHPSDGRDLCHPPSYPAALPAGQRRPPSSWNRLGDRFPLPGIHLGIRHRRRSIPAGLVPSTALQMGGNL